MTQRAVWLMTAWLATTATGAHAQGTRIVVHTWSPLATPTDGLHELVSRPETLESMAAAAWDAARGRVCDEVKAKVPGSVRAKDAGAAVPLGELVCDFGPAGNVALTVARQNVTTVIRIPNNKVRLKVELDGGRPDFYVDIPFSITGALAARVGAPGRLMTMTAATTAIDVDRNKVKIDGATVVGDAAVALARIAKIDIAGMIERGIEAQPSPLGGVVEAFNNAMAQAAPTAIAQAVGVRLWRRGSVSIFSLTPRYPAVPRSTASGTVIARVGMPDCDGMAFNASASGPGVLDDPFASPPRFRAGERLQSRQAVARVQGAPKLPPTPYAEGVTSERRCTYAINDAPVGAAISVSGGGQGRSRNGEPAGILPGERAVRLPAGNVDFATGWGQAFKKPQINIRPDWREITPAVPIDRSVPTTRPVIRNRPLNSGVVRPQGR